MFDAHTQGPLKRQREPEEWGANVQRPVVSSDLMAASGSQANAVRLLPSGAGRRGRTLNDAMRAGVKRFRKEHEAVEGRPFAHFLCPILFADEDVDLCQAHVVNEAFRGADRAWTVQRADVDSFYGSISRPTSWPSSTSGRPRPRRCSPTRPCR